MELMDWLGWLGSVLAISLLLSSFLMIGVLLMRGRRGQRQSVFMIAKFMIAEFMIAEQVHECACMNLHM